MAGTDIQRWGDTQQYHAAPMQADDFNGNILPRVTLISATPDPLGAIAAMCRMYEGTPTYSLDDITDQERLHYLDEVQATHLKAPLEAVNLHFFIEGVTRSFTHQMVRQRTAVFAQESLRFAVKDNAAGDVARPPSIMELKDDDPKRILWEAAIHDVGRAYENLVNNGIPAEDARGLLPHAITTRLNYGTNLRALIDHAGNRLCTQAQFEWRLVFLGILQSLQVFSGFRDVEMADGSFVSQGHVLARSGMFKPVCYQQGKCPFKAGFDRECTIRGRVEKFAAGGVPSTEWDRPHNVNGEFVPEIKTEEWMTNPAAARKYV